MSKGNDPANVRPAGSAVADAGAFRSALARVLDTTAIAEVVPHLAPETLHDLIRHCGLDACGELVAAATPGQLAAVFDIDLWRQAQPGRDDRFNADRFGEWLEALVDYDPAEAARIVSTLDARLVVAGLSRYIHVVDLATFEPSVDSDDEPMASGDGRAGAGFELGGCAVNPRRHDAWDAILALLQALEAEHPAAFRDVMDGCRRLSDIGRELDGLDDLLATPEQWVHDVATERDERREGLGYSTPADARAFLQLARQRGCRPSQVPRGVGPTFDVERPAEPVSIEPEIAHAIASVVELVANAAASSERPRALLTGPSPTASRFACIQPLMAHVHARDATRYHARMQELAFLTNTLAAGCGVQDRPLTPQEASDAVVGICNLGLDVWPARWPEEAGARASVPVSTAVMPVSFLVDHDLTTAFEAGWAALYEEVSVLVAEQLMRTLADLRCADAALLVGLRTLRTKLRMHIERGTPWQAREALDVLAVLDTPAWVSLLGLLNECPILPAAVTAIVGRSTGTISPTDFEFISTRRQLGLVREFMARLADLLRS